MIRSMAMAIADAQWELDKSSTVVTELMSGQRLLRDIDTGELINADGSIAWFDPVENTYKKKDIGGVVTNVNSEGTINPVVVDSRVFFGYTYETDEDSQVTKRIPQRLSMMELGFTPTFYQFVDTIIEVKIAIKITQNNDYERKNAYKSSYVNKDYGYRYNGWFSYYRFGNRTTTSTSQVDANYSNRYSYSVDGASLLRTKLVPIPPPAILEDRIRQLMEQEEAIADQALNAAVKKKNDGDGGDSNTVVEDNNNGLSNDGQS
ncbi:hypothetical protein [Marinibactrum halimedae]|nr:hypothetical protein [Marinibactrum halimedae]